MKILFFVKSLLLNIVPCFLFDRYKRKLETKFRSEDEAIKERVDYYCKLVAPFEMTDNAESRENGYRLRKQSAYYYDLKQYLYYFPKHFKFCYHFGDETETESCPALYKARPIKESNQDSILLKLNKRRHFRFVNDQTAFRDKKDMAVFRGRVKQEHRIRFMHAMFDHPLVNAGQSNESELHPKWKKPFMSVNEQLKYKFIICLEGNDVASNLKWVMSSNSIVVTPKMRFETWFMEGTLQPGVHYIEVSDDWSDFDEKISYYLNNPSEAEKIIVNAHQHVEQFKNTKREDWINIKTLEKYFALSQQK